jgi:hypothetical protein
VQELPLFFFPQDLPLDIRDATYASIQRSLIRNQQLNRVALLLVVAPLQGRRQQHQQQLASSSSSSMMLKISHKAIAKLAAVGNRNNATKPDRHCWKSASNDHRPLPPLLLLLLLLATTAVAGTLNLVVVNNDGQKRRRL